MEEDDKVRISKKWLQQLSRGVGSAVDVSTSQSLQVIHAQKGIMRCCFVVSERLTVTFYPPLSFTFVFLFNSSSVLDYFLACLYNQDGNGNWHVGAMATLIDNIAGATVHSFAGQIRPTLDFSMSYYSSPKVQVIFFS